MTEPQNSTQTENAEERVYLRDKAKLLGITHSPNISNKLLKERIAAVQNDQQDPGEPGFTGAQPSPSQDEIEEEDNGPVRFDEVDIDTQAQRIALGRPRIVGSKLTKRQRMQIEREKQWAEQLRLVRVRITCHNPAKAQLAGEIISVANKFVGTVRRFVPFGDLTNDGWHIPYIIYTELLGRQFQSVTAKKKDNHGLVILPEWRLLKEFSIELLPDLDAHELEKLARTQSIAMNQ